MVIAIVGAAGLALTQGSEGVVYKTYRDPVGIVTACYGHTGPELRMGMTFTKDQCAAMLQADLAKHQAYVRPGSSLNCIGNVPLNRNQLDAVTDFVFNVGPTKACASTLAARLRARDYAGAANEFPKWVNAGGKPLPGLVERRRRERALFLAPITPATVQPLSGASAGK